MEQETILKEILNALKLHGDQMNNKFEQIDSRFEQIDSRFEQIDSRFEQIDRRFEQLESKFDQRFDRLEKKVDGIRVELTETQETTDFILSKTAQHEKKLRHLSEQQHL
ncbi:hypothetical protein [Oceanobacillus saliphilus]|uniref:hypothetical protein n=1 Tax=Oceanobacillus saliphilus TaxID=2925834 RepID=UPI00201DE7C6